MAMWACARRCVAHMRPGRTLMVVPRRMASVRPANSGSHSRGPTRQWPVFALARRSPHVVPEAAVLAQSVATPPQQCAPRPKFLPPELLGRYADRRPPFGFNGLGHFVFRRTYSRLKDDGINETWHETVERVVEGTFEMQRQYFLRKGRGWSEARHLEALRRAADMYERIFTMKFLPPGRGLWAMGSDLVEQRGVYAGLNNCGFVSTAILHDASVRPSRPFTFLMEAAMLGVGVGFDTLGAKVSADGQSPLIVQGCDREKEPEVHVIADSREGWTESVALLIDHEMKGAAPILFDYDLIRPEGSPIKGFGGTASGPVPLRDLHTKLHELLQNRKGRPVSETLIVDIMNWIGKCVMAGNTRQTAEIAFGDPESEEYLDLKNYVKNPDRMEVGWASNNSVMCNVGMQYEDVCKRVRANGEPGFAWLDNMRKYGRMVEAPDNKDVLAMGGNPCLEQTLESFELCCLVETFPNHHESVEDYVATLESAFLYAKTVTLGLPHWPETANIMARNRRIGTSMTGIAQFLAQRGTESLRQWCETGYQAIQNYDAQFSSEFGVPKSIKTTCVKPSGTVSLLAGATPGMHYAISRYCIRRVRLPQSSVLLLPMREAGYHVEDAVGQNGTAVVSIPVDMGEGVRPQENVSMWEQLSLAAFMQRHWADNQVSCTVTFDPETEGPHIAHALEYFQYQLKGISFLPALAAGAYPQMPIEAITEAEYVAMTKRIQHLDIDQVSAHPTPDMYCNTDRCELPLK